MQIVLLIFFLIFNMFWCFTIFVLLGLLGLNASNYFIIMFSFNGFVHELKDVFFVFFLFKDVSWYKYLARSNRVSWHVSLGKSNFYLAKCLRCILYSFVILLITFILELNLHSQGQNLVLVAFLSLRVNSINIKRNFFSKLTYKSCRFCHIHMSLIHYYSS